MTKLLIAAAILLCATACLAQAPVSPDPRAAVRTANERLLEAQQTAPKADLHDYKIGPEDLVEISVFEVPEMSRTVRVSGSGYISLPLIGQIRAAGLTPQGLEQELTAQLKRSYIKDPQVAVFLKEFKSDPVSVLGAVQMPGTYQIQTPKSLLEVLAMARGFSDIRPPGREIVIVRKRSRTGAAQPDGAADQPETVHIPVADLIKSADERWNVTIYPGDTIRVAPALSVYVAGDVTKPGAFPLTGFENMSAVQALAMAGGTVRTAKASDAVVIRIDEKGNRIEQKVNLTRVLLGKDPDFLLHPNDILFVPGSMSKSAALRAIEAGIQITTGMLIWRR